MATRKSATKESAASKTTTKKTAAKTAMKKAPRPSATPPSRRWSAKVTSDSTHPGPGLFKQDAETIAKEMLKPAVSPKGPGQAMQMLSFYENRAGKNLPTERRRALEKAKDIVREREDEDSAPKRRAAKKSAAKKRPAKKSAKKTSAKKKSTGR